MRFAHTCQQARGYLLICVAGAAAILLPALTCSAQIAPASQQPQAPWAQTLNKYPGLLPEIGQLMSKLQEKVQFPAARAESRLLPLLPASTTSYAAFPNYGDTARHALQIFRQELQSSSVLRDWWTSGDLATGGPKLEEALEKFCQLHEFLGDEIVVSGAPSGKEPNFLVFAEVRKPGLKKFLEQAVAQLAGKSKPGVRVLDLPELAAAKSADLAQAEEFLVLVRPDFVVGATDLATLRSFNGRLDPGSREFASTPFGKRVLQEYQGGVTVLAAADVHKILEQAPPGPAQSQAAFQRSGFADMKYLVWKHSMVSGQSVSQAELSFDGPRKGAAAWLAKPAPLGSLGFVSPQAILSGTVVLASLPQILEDIQEMSGPSNANTFAGITAGEKMLNLSLKDDLLSLFSGELTVELDSFNPSQPAWKTILKVNDAQHLQKTLGTLLAMTQFRAEHIVEDGLSYYIVRIPAQKTAVEIAYAFVDGYLIVASSHDGLAEAVRLHKSGTSLANSKKFLDSLPPGHSSDASAVLYQNAVGMTAVMLQQASPELADSLSQFSKEAPPTFVWLYGEPSAIREASSSGSFDLGTTLVVAAIAIPNLLRSRIAANEASAVGSVRTVNTAQVTYEAMYPKRGFAPNLATLGSDSRGNPTSSPNYASLISETLANPSCTGNAWCTKSGYHFRVTASCRLQSCKEYVVVAIPVDSNAGTRGFCSTSDGVIHVKSAGPFSAPLTASECRAWPSIQ